MTHKEYESKSQMKRVEILKAGEKQMTHEELLAKIDDIRIYHLPETTSELAWERLADATRALRAVVELHKPENVYLPNGLGEKIDVCEDCQNDIGQTIYPCPTIQAIQEQLK